jgi:D-glycero-alpha-D-manno-heptose 1-phosphate guanylyltransferase
MTSTDIVVLCGGLGTRLQSVVSDLPKSLAPINGIPFLKILLTYYKKQGYTRFILCTGYMHSAYEDFVKTMPELNIVLSKEETPLGTGGAIVNALPLVNSASCIVVNGDSFLESSFETLELFHKNNNADLTFCLTPVADSSRYGRLELDEFNKVVGFVEKDPDGKPGLINTGIYMINTSIFSDIAMTKFSFETDFLSKSIKDLNMMAYDSGAGLFIDIGIPDSYEESQILLERFIG